MIFNLSDICFSYILQIYIFSFLYPILFYRFTYLSIHGFYLSYSRIFFLQSILYFFSVFHTFCICLKRYISVCLSKYIHMFIRKCFSFIYHIFSLEVPVVSWLSSLEMDTATRVQILDETDCISHSTNTLGKGMNPIIPPPAMGK